MPFEINPIPEFTEKGWFGKESWENKESVLEIFIADFDYGLNRWLWNWSSYDGFNAVINYTIPLNNNLAHSTNSDHNTDPYPNTHPAA